VTRARQPWSFIQRGLSTYRVETRARLPQGAAGECQYDGRVIRIAVNDAAPLCQLQTLAHELWHAGRERNTKPGTRLREEACAYTHEVTVLAALTVDQIHELLGVLVEAERRRKRGR